MTDKRSKDLDKALRSSSDFLELLQEEVQREPSPSLERASDSQKGIHPSSDTICDYVQGVLSESDTERVMEHLAVCGTCATDVLRARRVVRELQEQIIDWANPESWEPSSASDLENAFHKTHLIPVAACEAVVFSEPEALLLKDEYVDINLYDPEVGDHRASREDSPKMQSKNTTMLLFGGKNGLYSVEAEEGNLVWLFETTSPVASAPVVQDGRVFFGCYGGTLHAVHLETGKADWVLQTNEKSWSGFAVDHSVLCYSGSDKAVHAIDTSTGKELWKFSASTRIPAAPTISDWTVYFADSFGRVYAVDIVTGIGKCLYEKKDFWNYSVAVEAPEPTYLSASQIAHQLTEELGPEKCNALRLALEIKALTGEISSPMVNKLLDGLELHYKNEVTKEWCLGEKAKRIGKRTVKHKVDGSANAYIRWKEEVLELIRPAIDEKISGSE